MSFFKIVEIIMAQNQLTLVGRRHECGLVIDF
jgi:hypothetical protein